MVKTNVVEVLRRELASPRWTGEHIAMGTATDPYQHCEGRYRLTRGVIEVIGEFENPLSMLTKSTMILRDLDLYRRLNEVAPLTISMSVGTLDEKVRRIVEPGTRWVASGSRSSRASRRPGSERACSSRRSSRV